MVRLRNPSFVNKQALLEAAPRELASPNESDPVEVVQKQTDDFARQKSRNS
jgi:hypothetical protein